MSDLDQMIEHLRSLVARPEALDRDWYRIEAKADPAQSKAEVWLYDDIGWMGTSAKTFSTDLLALDVDEIDLHLNSPGGGAWDGLAIHNTLRDHRAKVTVIVDGMAASAASVIAMAGDTIRMNRGAQMMVHDARGVAAGPPAVMAEAVAVLDKISDAMAGIYAAKAGGSVEEWRALMGAETWYSAQEAVDAGLADELVSDPSPEASARWDVAAYAFAHAGRSAAPAPVISRRPEPPKAEPISAAEAARLIHAASHRNNPKEASMDAAKIREALGLAADAPDDEVKAALTSAGLVDQPDPPEAAADPAPETKPRATAPGTMTVDVSAWQDREERLKRLEAQATKQRADERDQVIAQAVTDGKFAPARTEHWARLWNADPEGTREVISGLSKNVVPVAELGYAGGDDASIDDEFRHLFPPALTKGA